jgi:hypothetical protein
MAKACSRSVTIVEKSGANWAKSQVSLMISFRNSGKGRYRYVDPCASESGHTQSAVEMGRGLR